MSDYETRFGGIARLYGTAGLDRLRLSHVCVVGIGGVGTWTVEALARSGVGTLTLIDMDDICVTNVNRQLHALDGNIGKSKVEAMSERVRAINPDAALNALTQFFTTETCDELLKPAYDCVVDAIDNVPNKCHLIAACRTRNIPVVTSGGAGGRRDPGQVKLDDLARTTHDRLLQKVRETLRKEHGFPKGDKQFGVPAVYSPERPQFPQSDGTVCGIKEAGSALKLDCNSGYGTATFVTGTFGFLAAAKAVEVCLGRAKRI